MTFTLDTSGAVIMPNTEEPVRWEDLSPFAQGYIAAMFEALRVPGPDGPEPLLYPAFSDLAPEALAAILRHCEGVLDDAGKVQHVAESAS